MLIMSLRLNTNCLSKKILRKLDVTKSLNKNVSIPVGGER